MTKVSLSILLLAGLGLTRVQGQAPTDVFEKAPPGVEEALRDRVNGFYKTWTEGRFRAGEKFVSESSQETYYSIQKQKLEHCEILRIKFEREFNDAMVTVACKGKINIQGQELDSTLAHTAFWTLENELWYWTIKPVRSAPSPFGEFNYANVTGSGDLFNPDTGLPKDPKAVNQLGQGIINLVTIDKQEVRLSSYEKATALVTIKNGLTGYINLRVVPDGAPIGFFAELDETKVAANGEAHLRLTYDPGTNKAPKETAWVRVSVDQTGRIFPIKVTFAIPPEVEKQIQKSRTGK